MALWPQQPLPLLWLRAARPILHDWGCTVWQATLREASGWPLKLAARAHLRPELLIRQTKTETLLGARIKTGRRLNTKRRARWAGARRSLRARDSTSSCSWRISSPNSALRFVAWDKEADEG